MTDNFVDVSDFFINHSDPGLKEVHHVDIIVGAVVT